MNQPTEYTPFNAERLRLRKRRFWHLDTPARRFIAAMIFAIVCWAVAVWYAISARALDVAPILWHIEMPMSEWNKAEEHRLRDKCLVDGGHYTSVTEDYTESRVTVFCHKRIDRRPEA